MKKIHLLAAFLCTISHLSAQHYWQQEVDYKIKVSLIDSTRSLDASLDFTYKNNSPDTLHFIWVQLWPNAYKNDRTAFCDQLLEDGNTSFYFSDESKRGYINRLNFTSSGDELKTEDHPQHQDMIKLLLPAPLFPGKSIEISTPFRVKLPFAFSRMGYYGSSFQVTQWYPKPAVYDKNGWHPMPYLNNGEFYSEFGSFDVTISVPEKYTVAATGNLISEKLLEGKKILQFEESNIHDFAWFADSTYLVKKAETDVDGKPVAMEVYFHKKSEKKWDSAISFIKQTLFTRGKWIGNYPYKTVKVVESLVPNAGGMEYPTITVIATPTDNDDLANLIGHEVGHNWFYGMLGTNERMYPWMDEGMNSYYDTRYEDWRNSQSKSQSKKVNLFFPDDSGLGEVAAHTLISINKDQPINTPSENFSLLNYNAIAYGKTSIWMALLEEKLGSRLFDTMMQEYFNAWRFKHPQPADFKAIAAKYLHSDTDSIFALLDSRGYINKPKRKGLALRPFIGFSNTESRNNIFISPALGYNIYDGWMAGAIFHNYTLPVTPFRFVVAPLFATQPHKFNFIGKIGYHYYSKNGSQLEFSVSGAKFAMNSFKDSTGKKNFLSFQKIVPTLRYSLAYKSARSTMKKYIQWKTFLINETGINFRRDTVFHQDVITYPKSSRYLNQLSLVVENSRALYPYSAVFQAEQADRFIRLNLTTNYYFNFAKGGGLNFRFFAGKFIYTTEKTSLTRYQTDRFHLNMTGPKGDEDYTYHDYFVGRNEFAYTVYDPKISTTKNFTRGLPVAQIMQRDGFFKIRTDLLSNKIGKTDDWLTAINISTTIPNSVNPLSLFPFKIPLKIFLDVGTYAGAWDKDNSNGRFLYDAGLQLSLLKNSINIYFPILYSKVYKDYVNSVIVDKKFLKNISFSIDLQNLALNKLFSLSPF